MMMLIEVDKLKIPLPLSGAIVKSVLHRHAGFDRDTVNVLWKALRTATAAFPVWVLTEVQEAEGSHIKITILKNSFYTLAKNKKMCYTEKN